MGHREHMNNHYSVSFNSKNGMPFSSSEKINVLDSNQGTEKIMVFEDDD